MTQFPMPQPTWTQAEKDAFIAGILAMREKAVASTPSPYYVHGPTGILSMPGQRADVMNAMLLPVGIQAELPYRLSRDNSPVFPILTGQTDSTGSEPVSACDDAPQPGNLKICNQTWPFGRHVRDSQVMQADRAGLLVNSRYEFLDARLVGNPFTNLERPQEISIDEALRTEVGKKLVELYNAWLLDFSPIVYSGNPANTAGNTGYIEYNGFDKIINTGYQDAYSGQACPAADSVIVNFGGNTITGNENQIVTDIVEVYAYLKYLSERVGLAPVTWKIAMRYELFRQLTQIWPCVYMTYRCTFGQTTNATNFVDARDQQNLRDSMRAERYLLIDGVRVDVVVDDNITETVPASNTFMSDVYFIPMTVRGNRPVTYMEYFDLNAPGGMRDVTQAWAPNQFEIIGGGRFWLHRKPSTNECIQVRLGAKPRLIVETPFLAARLTNVKYSPPLFHSRSPFPDSPYYFVDGGPTSQSQPFFYSPTA